MFKNAFRAIFFVAFGALAINAIGTVAASAAQEDYFAHRR